jgi:hypothetical protein
VESSYEKGGGGIIYSNNFFLQQINVFYVFIYHITKFKNDWMNDTLIINTTVMEEAQNFVKSRIGVYMGSYAGISG